MYEPNAPTSQHQSNYLTTVIEKNPSHKYVAMQTKSAKTTSYAIILIKELPSQGEICFIHSRPPLIQTQIIYTCQASFPAW